MSLYETTSMEILHTHMLCAQVGNRTRDVQATMSMLLQLATKPHPPTIGARQTCLGPCQTNALRKEKNARLNTHNKDEMS